MGDGPGCLEKGADLLGNRRFESTSLRRRVGSKPVPTSVHAHRFDEQELANWRGGRNAHGFNESGSEQTTGPVGLRRPLPSKPGRQALSAATAKGIRTGSG